MATDNTGKPGAASNPDPLAELDKFLSKFADLASQLPKAMLAHVTDGDEKELISAFAGPLQEQVAQLSDYARQRSKGASRQVVEDIGTILRLNAADALTDSGMRVAQNLASPKAKIGLSDIMKLIKKIIFALIDVLHIKLPDWIKPLLELIDEIIDFLLSVGSAKLASTLSTRHQNYLSELSALENWQGQGAWRKQDVEEDE